MTDLDLLRESTNAAVQAALKRYRGVQIKNGVFQERTIDRIGGLVILDGDDDAVGALIAVDLGYAPGDRVICVSYPPAGLMIVGKRGGAYEDWRFVGDAENPKFDSNWANVSTVGSLDEDAFMRVGFKRQGARTELRGRATRISGSGNPDGIFILPDEYRPRNDINCIGAVGPIFAAAVIIVLRAGNVRVLTVAGSVDQASGGYVSLDGISFAND